jgi:hypothetical protein
MALNNATFPLCSKDVAFDPITFFLFSAILTGPNIIKKLGDVAP